MLFRVILLSLAGLAVMLGLAYWTARPELRDEPSAGEVIGLFDRLAFSGYGESGPAGTGPYLRRWSAPVRIAVVGAPTQWADEPLDWYQRVSALTQVWDSVRGLDIAVVAQAPFDLDAPELTTAEEMANLTVAAISRKDIDIFASFAGLPPAAAVALGSERDGCIVVGDAPPVIDKVMIAMRADLNENRALACLREGMAAGLGLSIEAKNQSDVFRSRNGTLSFHPLGRMAAGLAYHPDLAPGMPRAQALEAARAVLAEEGVQERGID